MVLLSYSVAMNTNVYCNRALGVLDMLYGVVLDASVYRVLNDLIKHGEVFRVTSVTSTGPLALPHSLNMSHLDVFKRELFTLSKLLIMCR